MNSLRKNSNVKEFTANVINVKSCYSLRPNNTGRVTTEQCNKAAMFLTVPATTVNQTGGAALFLAAPSMPTD